MEQRLSNIWSIVVFMNERLKSLTMIIIINMHALFARFWMTINYIIQICIFLTSSQSAIGSDKVMLALQYSCLSTLMTWLFFWERQALAVILVAFLLAVLAMQMTYYLWQHNRSSVYGKHWTMRLQRLAVTGELIWVLYKVFWLSLVKSGTTPALTIYYAWIFQ
jgi:hypothetical protein